MSKEAKEQDRQDSEDRGGSVGTRAGGPVQTKGASVMPEEDLPGTEGAAESPANAPAEEDE